MRTGTAFVLSNGTNRNQAELLRAGYIDGMLAAPAEGK
jgi:hypothetical protein